MTAFVNHVIILVQTVRTMGFFNVNISKLPSQFPPASTASTATVNGAGPLVLSEFGIVQCWKKIIKIKVLNISDSFLLYFVANMYGYIFPHSNYL